MRGRPCIADLQGQQFCPWCIVEMGRSSVNVEAQPKNSAKRSARQHVTIRPDFGNIWLHFI